MPRARVARPNRICGIRRAFREAPRRRLTEAPDSAPGDPSANSFLGTAQPSRQRFENWKLRRALRFPYFLRSTTRLSRVRNPAAFSAGRSDGS